MAPDTLLPTCVTLFSVGNLLGRLLCMNLSNILVNKGKSRMWFVCIILILMTISHLAFLLAAGLATAGSSLQSLLLIFGSLGIITDPNNVLSNPLNKP